MTELHAGAINRVRWQDAVLARRVERTNTITSFYFTLAQPFAFWPGQHVDVRLTAEDGYHAIRSYSIASAPPGGLANEIELAVEKLSDGEVSPFFHNVIQPNDVIEVKGPLGGHFVWPGDQAGSILLIGGGSGLVPLMSMIRYRAETGSSIPLALLLSARTWDDVLYIDELCALSARGNGFIFALALTREAPRREGDFGRRIDAEMIRALAGRLPSSPEAVFVCGTNEFVNAATNGVEALGVPAVAIKTERYGDSSK
jgi:ferredoxin-NADP reductase